MSNHKKNHHANHLEIQKLPLHYRFPFIKVKVVDDFEQIDFRLSGHFTVEDLNGRCVFESLTGEARWRVVVEASAPAKFEYGVVVHEFYSPEKAKEQAQHLREKGYEAQIRSFGYRWQLGENRTIVNESYRVYLDGFPTIREARKMQRRLVDFDRPNIFRYRAREARGVLEMFDVNFSKSTKCGGPIKLTPRRRDSVISLLNIRARGDVMEFPNLYGIEFSINDKGKLQCLAEMDIEAYVGGLLTAQYHKELPDTYLRALAITLRSWVAANWGRVHKDEPYQFCSSEHCFLLSGLKGWPRRVVNIMRETKGLVLTCDNEICDTPSHPVCGGHTEDLENVAGIETKPYLTSFFDTAFHQVPDGAPDVLNNEEALETWIASRPNVYCKPGEDAKTGALGDFQRFFRWEVEYTRQELEEILSVKLGEEVGMLFDIVPLKRGKSGRLSEVEILGSRQNIKLVGDEAIRDAFAEGRLPSTCFVIRVELDEQGIPTFFHFHGAGNGHGVGMCQFGAISQSLAGTSTEKILEHYFGTDVKLEKLPMT